MRMFSCMVSCVGSPSFNFDTQTVWILVVAVILVASLLSAWFSSRPMTQTNMSRPEQQSLRKKMLNARLTLDAVLQQGMVSRAEK